MSDADRDRYIKTSQEWELDSSFERWFPLTAERLAYLESKLAAAEARIKQMTEVGIEVMSGTPQVDRETYTVSKADIGFKVVGVALAKSLERKAQGIAETQTPVTPRRVELIWKDHCTKPFHDGLEIWRTAEALEREVRELKAK